MCGEEAFTQTSMRQYTLIELFPVATSCPPLSVFIALQVDAQMVGILSKCTLTELLPVATCMWQIHDIYHDIHFGFKKMYAHFLYLYLLCHHLKLTQYS